MFWIEGVEPLRVGITPRPRGDDWLETEIARLLQEGVDVLVSMLTSDEESELGLTQEAACCEEFGLEFRRFSIRDRRVPDDPNAFIAWLHELEFELAKGRSIAVHCRASIGRSSLLLASLLKLHGHSAQEAFGLITNARGLQVPDTSEQIDWVERLKIHRG